LGAKSMGLYRFGYRVFRIAPGAYARDSAW
jgi:hypothetical protein